MGDVSRHKVWISVDLEALSIIPAGLTMTQLIVETQ